MQIAQEKIDYKIEQINMMEYRQSDERYSKKRQSLINQMERANPLRRIEDEDHAQRILNASERHNNTNYENELDNARELAELGEINRGEVREHARMAIV